MATDGDRAPRAVGSPTEFPLPFATIRAVKTLPDGRLVVSDPQENVLAIVNFQEGTRQSLGRVGEGPGEFRRVGGLYKARGGGVWLLDHALRRLIAISPNGVLQDVIGLPTAGAAASWSAYGPDPLVVDTLGHAYAAIRFGGFTAPTSVLLRFRAGLAPDTITHLMRPLTKAVKGAVSSMEYQEVLFSPEDAWIVSPDGRVAVVRASPYRVEWVPLTGATVTGPIIHHRAVPIDQTEKELIASGAAGRRGRITVRMGMFPPGGAPSSGSSIPEPIPVGDLLFANAKTPVNIRDGSWPMLDERGRLWVRRNVPSTVEDVVLDVFDGEGNLVDRFTLPTGSRLVGFDHLWLYAARFAPDGFEYLQRVPVP